MNQLAPWDNSAAHLAQIDALVAKVDSLRVRRIHKPNFVLVGTPELSPYAVIRKRLRRQPFHDAIAYCSGLAVAVCAALGVALLLVNPQ